jgi:hypothetical protein
MFCMLHIVMAFVAMPQPKCSKYGQIGIQSKRTYRRHRMVEV